MLHCEACGVQAMHAPVSGEVLACVCGCNRFVAVFPPILRFTKQDLKFLKETRIDPEIDSETPWAV